MTSSGEVKSNLVPVKVPYDTLFEILFSPLCTGSCRNISILFYYSFGMWQKRGAARRPHRLEPRHGGGCCQKPWTDVMKYSLLFVTSPMADILRCTLVCKWIFAKCWMEQLLLLQAGICEGSLSQIGRAMRSCSFWDPQQMHWKSGLGQMRVKDSKAGLTLTQPTESFLTLY